MIDALVADARALAAFDRVCTIVADSLRAGGKVLACGNGGSACDAAHFCEELSGKFRQDRPPIGALACTDAGHITCVANDYGFEHVFSRWVEAVGRRGDVLILLSTSGNSPNLLRAAGAARAAGLTTVAFLGRGGGELRELVDDGVVVPGKTSDRIQELHMLLLHALAERTERTLHPDRCSQS